MQIQALFDKVLGMEIGKNDCRKSSGGPNQEKSGIIEDKTFFNKGACLLNDHINCIAILLLLV
jgi:hypothetical protein